MTRTPRLALRRETLARLTDGELADLAGASVEVSRNCPHGLWTRVCATYVSCVTGSCTNRVPPSPDR